MAQKNHHLQLISNIYYLAKYTYGRHTCRRPCLKLLITKIILLTSTFMGKCNGVRTPLAPSSNQLIGIPCLKEFYGMRAAHARYMPIKDQSLKSSPKPRLINPKYLASHFRIHGDDGWLERLLDPGNPAFPNDVGGTTDL